MSTSKKSSADTTRATPECLGGRPVLGCTARSRSRIIVVAFIVSLIASVWLSNGDDSSLSSLRSWAQDSGHSVIAVFSKKSRYLKKRSAFDARVNSCLETRVITQGIAGYLSLKWWVTETVFQRRAQVGRPSEERQSQPRSDIPSQCNCHIPNLDAPKS